MGASSVETRNAVRRFFRPGGLLAAKHPAFELRQGQMEMAAAVEEALSENRKLIVEAGTGTGKTLAYLVPALLSERRVVISTGTKALQEQLVLSRYSVSRKSVRPAAARLLHERPQQLRLPAEDLRGGGYAGAFRSWKKWPIFRSSRSGRRQRKPATGRRSGRCPRTAPPGRRSMRARNSARDRSASSTSAASSR